MLSSWCFFFIISFCFFSWYGDHRHLHSFPTRRSSDLSAASGAWSRTSSAVSIGSERRITAVARSRSIERLRSEEHTSELQSRVDLVCRLLLEKKNTYSGSRRTER